MMIQPIKIEITADSISDLGLIIEAIKKLRNSNPDETLDVTIRVENAEIYKTVVKPGMKIGLV
jgi:hypothetical protein